MTTIVVNGVTNVSLPDLIAGDLIQLVGNDANVVLEVCVYEDARAHLLVQTSAMADPVKVWLRRHSLIQLLSEPRPPVPASTTPEAVVE